MSEAIPVLHLLVRRNLQAFTPQLAVMDVECADERGLQIAPHLAWLHAATEEMARQGRFTIGTRPLSALPVWSSSGQFNNPGIAVPMRPHGQGQTKFAHLFSGALSNIAPAVGSSASSSEERFSWISRWIASAALTAHLMSGGEAPFATTFAAMDAPLGEDAAANEATYSQFMVDCSAAVLLLLPQYKFCERAVSQEWRDQLAGSFQILHDSRATPRDHYRAKGAISNLLAYLTTNPPKNVNIQPWPTRRHERAKLLLQATGICASLEDASECLRILDFADMFPVRDQPKDDDEVDTSRKRGQHRRRFETDGAEHAASHRGRLAYAKLWEKVFSANQLLLPQLVEACWTSEAARRVILRNHTSARQLQVSSDVSTDDTLSVDVTPFSAEKEVPQA